MSMLYRVTRNEKYLNAAQKSQEFIEMNLSDRLNLYTSFRDGKCSKHAFLDDYAFYIAAITEHYDSTERTFRVKSNKRKVAFDGKCKNRNCLPPTNEPVFL